MHRHLTAVSNAGKDYNTIRATAKVKKTTIFDYDNFVHTFKRFNLIINYLSE